MPDDYGNPDPDWLKLDWRPHLHRVQLPGGEVNYAEIGEGDPIVFVHGISGSWQNWLENLPHFGRNHRAIALDLPGFGASPMPSWPIDMPAYGRLLHDFCEKLGVGGGATLVGNSMGGLVAAEAILSTPGRFDRLVLVSAAGFINTWLPHQRGVATSHAWNTFGRPFGSAARFVVSHRRARYLMFRFFIRHPDRLGKELLWEQMASGLPCPGFADALDAVLEYDARDRLEEIEIPTMIVWGSDDWVIPSAAALSYQRRIPHSRLETFEDTGHVPQMERPARFNAVLEEFLASPIRT
ncbi:MAG TPA: alpha/beta fold hydrolase [Solirubrobacterales bacterium]|nr:alpha/beta fold hydrolase [Solirubrobacterales bacterium]